MDQEAIKRSLCYSPSTGVFTWAVSPRPGVCAGDQAGSIDRKGYIRITFKRKGYRASRLAWFFVHNEVPSLVVDHINGCRTDNRIDNLRVVTTAENNLNRHGAQKNSKTGMLGVCLVNGKYRASYKGRYLGEFRVFEDALAARNAAKEAA